MGVEGLVPTKWQGVKAGLYQSWQAVTLPAAIAERQMQFVMILVLIAEDVLRSTEYRMSVCARTRLFVSTTLSHRSVMPCILGEAVMVSLLTFPVQTVVQSRIPLTPTPRLPHHQNSSRSLNQPLFRRSGNSNITTPRHPHIRLSVNWPPGLH